MPAKLIFYSKYALRKLELIQRKRYGKNNDDSFTISPLGKFPSDLKLIFLKCQIGGDQI